MKPLALALAAFGLVGAALTPAHATETERMSVTVNAADLNLASPEGQRKLDQRVEKAARTVCRVHDPRTGTRVMSHEARACLAKVRVEAKQQMALMISNQQRGG